MKSDRFADGSSAAKALSAYMKAFHALDGRIHVACVHSYSRNKIICLCGQISTYYRHTMYRTCLEKHKLGSYEVVLANGQILNVLKKHFRREKDFVVKYFSTSYLRRIMNKASTVLGSGIFYKSNAVMCIAVLVNITFLLLLKKNIGPNGWIVRAVLFMSALIVVLSHKMLACSIENSVTLKYLKIAAMQQNR